MAGSWSRAIPYHPRRRRALGCGGGWHAVGTDLPHGEVPPGPYARSGGSGVCDAGRMERPGPSLGKETGAADMLRRQFNRKAAASDVNIVGAGQFQSFNAEGTEITPVYDFVKKNLEK